MRHHNRLAPMKRRLRSLALGLVPAILFAACTAAPAAPASPSPSAPAPSSVPAASPSVPSSVPASPSAAAPAAPASPSPSASAPSPVPAASPSGAASETPTSGGAVAGNPGVTPIPVDGPGASGGVVPVQPPTEVTPVANLQRVHDVRAAEVRAQMSGNHLTATVLWWSGPAPCSQLSEVKVVASGTTFTLTVREGAELLGIACPALAMHKATTVDLGPIAPGTYHIAVLGVDTPITVVYNG